MVALTDLRRWDPAAVEDIVTALGEVKSRFEALDEQAAAARTSADAWQGAAADAARRAHDAIVSRLDELGAGVSAARLPVADAADGITALRTRLADLDARATATGFAIGADGAVTDVRQTVVAADQAEAYRADRIATQTDLVDALRQILAGADELDTTLLSAITRATGSHAAPPTTAPAGVGFSVDPGPAPTGDRTPVPVLGDPGTGYTPAPVLGPLITLPAPTGPTLPGTPAAPDLGLDRTHDSAEDPDPPFPPPPAIIGRTAHGEEQIQGRDGHGVSDEAVEDAVARPTQKPAYKPDQYGGTYEYVGRDATVHLNRGGLLVTAWANTRSGWRHP